MQLSVASLKFQKWISPGLRNAKRIIFTLFWVTSQHWLRVLLLIPETWILCLFLSCVDHWDPCTTSWEVTQQAARIYVMKMSSNGVRSISLVFMTAVPHNIEMPISLSTTESKTCASFRTSGKWLYSEPIIVSARQTDRRSTLKNWHVIRKTDFFVWKSY